jgi:pyruvate formate lyase activating enzyme
MAEIVQDEIFYDESGGGATFSGGEPMMQIAFLTALLAACRSRGIHTAVDTCGYAPETDFDRVYELVDLFLFDLKIMDPSLHHKHTGVSNGLIHSNLAFLALRGDKVIVRIPMIPEITDTEENLSAICSFLEPYANARRISLLPYNKLGADKSERYGLVSRAPGWETQSAEEISRRRALFESRGFSVTVGG